MKKSISLRRALITIESIIKKADDYLTADQILEIAYARGIKTTTFHEALDWLYDNNKIILDGDEIVWVAVDNAKLRKLLKESVLVAKETNN